MKYHLGDKFFGLVLLAIGVGYIGDLCNAWQFTIFFPGWWTMFIILPSVVSILNYGIHFWNVVSTLFGVALLLSSNDIFDMKYAMKFLLPIFLILWGLSILFGRKKWYHDFKSDFSKEGHGYNTWNDSGADVDQGVHFATNRRFLHKGKIKTYHGETVFASQVIDLRDADLSDTFQFEHENVFGRTQIIVNEDIKPLLHIENVLSGVHNYCKGGTKEVTMNISAVFSYVEIIQKSGNVKEGKFKEL